MQQVSKEDYHESLQYWTNLQILKGVPRDQICSLAIKQFGNHNPLSDSTIYKFYSSEYKNTVKIESAKQKKIEIDPFVEAQKITSRLGMMKQTTAKSVLDMVSAFVEGMTYGNRI